MDHSDSFVACSVSSPWSLFPAAHPLPSHVQLPTQFVSLNPSFQPCFCQCNKFCPFGLSLLWTDQTSTLSESSVLCCNTNIYIFFFFKDTLEGWHHDMMSHWGQARNAAWQSYTLSAFTKHTHRPLSPLSNLPNLHCGLWMDAAAVSSAWGKQSLSNVEYLCFPSPLAPSAILHDVLCQVGQPLYSSHPCLSSLVLEPCIFNLDYSGFS